MGFQPPTPELRKVGAGQLGQGPNLHYLSLQPDEHLLFCKQFCKAFPSAFRVSDLPGLGGFGPGSKLHQNLPWTLISTMNLKCHNICKMTSAKFLDKGYGFFKIFLQSTKCLF